MGIININQVIVIAPRLRFDVHFSLSFNLTISQKKNAYKNVILFENAISFSRSWKTKALNY